ncbi:hypothetical protein Tco_1487862, partial [Tanacetum coccineum]
MHDDETSNAYLNRAQEYANALATIGEPVKDNDLVMLVVLGKTRAPVLSITSSFAANYAVGSPSMPEDHTRANSHVTLDLEAMDNSKAYYGDDALHVGN